MKQTEALRLALEYVELVPDDRYNAEHIDQDALITAIKAALEAKDEPVAHSVVAGALFDFMGWLTSREKQLILSSVDEASPAVEAITEFAKKRNLSLKYAEVGYWMEFLSTPPQQEAKDEPVAWTLLLVGEHHGIIGKAGDAFASAPAHYRRVDVYTTPPQRKPLTDKEIGSCIDEVNLTSQYGHHHFGWHKQFARAIEAAHGIKG